MRRVFRFTDSEGLPITAEFDFRQTGPQSWDIVVDTDRGPLTLSGGGARLVAGGEVLVEAAEAEYRGLYRRFIELAATGSSDVDLTPLRLVADAFLLGRRRIVESFRRLTMVDAAPNVAREVFGVLPDGRSVERVSLRAANGFEARIITFGAALQALMVPDKDGAAMTSCSGMTSSKAISATGGSLARPSAATPTVSPTRASFSTAMRCN